MRQDQGGDTSDLRGPQGPQFWVYGQLQTLRPLLGSQSQQLWQGAQAAEQKRGPQCSPLTEGDALTQPHPPMGALSGQCPRSPRPVLFWTHLGTLGCPRQELTAHTPTGCRGPRSQSPQRFSLADVPTKCFSSVHRGLGESGRPPHTPTALLQLSLRTAAVAFLLPETHQPPAPRPVPANSPQGTVHTDEVTKSHCGCPGKKWAQ